MRLTITSAIALEMMMLITVALMFGGATAQTDYLGCNSSRVRTLPLCLVHHTTAPLLVHVAKDLLMLFTFLCRPVSESYNHLYLTEENIAHLCVSCCVRAATLVAASH